MPEEYLKNIHIVLVATTHPGNIGATARAMKTMGIKHLDLVSPKIFPHAEVTARAAGADDILMSAATHESLAEAVAECSLVLATSSRLRSISWPVLNAEQGAEQVIEKAREGVKIALVFGRESSGLTNEELELCNAMVQIPANPEFSSLNIASAVQIVCYELHKAIINNEINDKKPHGKDSPANIEQMNQLYEHLQKCMTDIGYYDPEKPRLLMRRLKRLFNRAQLDLSEYNIIRGILSAAQAAAKRNKA